jgi:Fur family transcriptional regulator, peroxide stress response regulator
MIEHDHQLEQFKRACKQHGLKLTPQRLVIYEALIAHNDHPSTDMLYQRVRKQFPTISFDTVHRTMLTFCDIGVADIIGGTGNPKRFDGVLDTHHHFQCLRCKTLLDIYDEAYDHLPVPTELQAQCRVLKQTVRFEGICHACLQNDTERASAP